MAKIKTAKSTKYVGCHIYMLNNTLTLEKRQELSISSNGSLSESFAKFLGNYFWNFWKSQTKSKSFGIKLSSVPSICNRAHYFDDFLVPSTKILAVIVLFIQVWPSLSFGNLGKSALL